MAVVFGSNIEGVVEKELCIAAFVVADE
jgi:hypothetical protein